jgi:hypothetical protein
MDQSHPEPREPEDDLDAHEVRRVDRQRLVAWLRRAEQRYFVGADGTLGGLWNGCPFTFMIVGGSRVLQIRGQWNRPAAIERRSELIELLNARHARVAWPKCFLLVLDDGSMRVAADHSVIIGTGLSERQLDRALRVGVTAGLAVFAELDAHYPDPVATPPESLA